MNQIAKSKVALLLSGLFAAAVPVMAQAANQPNAGNILDTVRDKDFTPSKAAEPGIEIQQEAQPAMKADNGSRVKVAAFHITGNTAFTEAKLQSVIAASVGRELSMADLEKVAAEISQFYRKKGYFVARAYLPAQEIKDGTVEIAVLEGRIGNVSVKLTGNGLLNESAVQNAVTGSIKPGDVISERHLERGLLLANDLAGVSVDSTLVPGASVGTSDLVVEAQRTGNTSASIDYDNFGNKFTGANRVGGSFSFNNQLGDQISLRLMTSGTGLRYGRASYLLPVGSSGTKVGVAFSGMHYQLGDQFAATNSYGDADIASLYAVYPVIRSRNRSLYFQAGYDNKHMTDVAGAQPPSDKRDNVFTAAFTGDSRDSFGSGGMNSFGATYFSGRLDLDPVTQAYDNTNMPQYAQTSGIFSKADYNVSRVQRLSDDLSLSAAFSGQSASKNLDTSEKFVLGGAGGVRAYPQGEASGDEGQLLNVELRRTLGANSYGNFQLIGFYDVGRTKLNKYGWQGGTLTPPPPNSYTLAGAGLGLNLSKAGSDSGGYAVKAYLATKLGSNPGATNGQDSDGTNSTTRFWLQASKWF
jgi:hemolysin activation/secretion protein